MQEFKRKKCKYCDVYLTGIDQYVAHLESSHADLIPGDMDGYRFLYYLQTGKSRGKCIICGKPTEWNKSTHKYARFCNNPDCKNKYRQVFSNRMIGKYGKVSLLDDPEQQRKMLAGRKISGKYRWSDHVHEVPYVGSYEHSFLEFLDVIMGYDANDIMSPSPHTYWYLYGGEKHFYIPDLFIPSLNLEIEIKDGGDNPNMHHKIQEVDKVKERLKDDVMKNNGSFNYLKLVNKDNRKFFDMLDKLKENYVLGNNKPVIMI